MPSEVLLDTRHDRPRRADGKLLARDLEDQGSERVEPRQLVHPRPGTEVRPRDDQAREHRIGVPKKLSRLAVGDPGSLASPRAHVLRLALHLIHDRCSAGAHSYSSRSVSTISTTKKVS